MVKTTDSPNTRRKRKQQRERRVRTPNPLYQNQREKSKTVNFMRVLIISLAGAELGFYTSVMNPLGKPLLQQTYGLEGERVEQILGDTNLLLSLGAFISVLSSGFIVDRLGRQKTLVISMVLSFVSYALYITKGLRFLLNARFLSGVVIGLNGTVSQLYVKEIFPKRLTVVGGMLYYFISSAVGLMLFLVSYFLGEAFLVENWRIIFVLPAPLCILRFLFFLPLMCFDTPKYYLQTDLQASSSP